VSPPYSADIYWNVTLSSMRRELAALYNLDEREMGAAIERITLGGILPQLRRPLFLAAGGHDFVTPGTEAWRIFEDACCEREIVYYPRGAHDRFNVVSDLRPRLISWLARKLERHQRVRPPMEAPPPNGWMAAEAVDIDFAEALEGEVTRPVWTATPQETTTDPVRWSWPWGSRPTSRLELIHRVAGPSLGLFDGESDS